MKKLFFLLLIIPFVFSSCKKDEDENSSSLAPPSSSCCIFSASGLNYNPTISVSGISETICDGSIVYTNSNNDITKIVVQFHSFCTGTDKDWVMAAGIDGQGSIIVSGTTYNITGTPNLNSPITTFLFQDYNCTQTEIDTYTNTSSLGNGTVNFVVDFSNSEISGTFTLTGTDPQGVLPPITVVCTFSNMPIQVMSI